MDGLEVFDSLTIFLKCFHEFRGSIWNSFFQLLDLAIESWYYSFRFKKKENMFFLWLNRAFGISIWIGDWEFQLWQMHQHLKRNVLTRSYYVRELSMQSISWGKLFQSYLTFYPFFCKDFITRYFSSSGEMRGGLITCYQAVPYFPLA